MTPTNTSYSTWRVARHGLVCAVVLAIGACSAGGIYQQDLMNAPDIYDVGGIDPFTHITPIDIEQHYGILYATDREPADEPLKPPFYGNARGRVLRLGSARVYVAREGVTWEDVRRISLLKNRTESFPLRVADVREYGVLDHSITEFNDPSIVAHKSELPGRLFAERVNAQLAKASVKDVIVYTHGFKVIFENPVLVASELWHYLGYEGVLIAYSWPATPSVWAYAYDTETTAIAGRNLRIFLEYLAEETDAERIHIVGYSAGTRVATGALWQLALLNRHLDKETIGKRLRIGHVILVGSDVDAGVFGSYLVDGILKVPAHLTVYVSGTDTALRTSSFLYFGKRRLGAWKDDNDVLSPVATKILREHDDLLAIHVGDAANTRAGNGHAYFRDSPWVSSDILITLRYGLLPEERGLVRTQDDPIWRFPPEYITNLRDTVYRVDPELAKRQAVDLVQ
jgi:esterase/lipase superfamily enzyme